MAFALADHITRVPPVEVALPWETSAGETVTVPLLRTSRERSAMHRNYFNPFVGKPALRAAGIEPTRINGMHALRHFYTSVLLKDGVSTKAVSEYLGHADPGLTPRTYTHLMPSSEDKARRALDRIFTGGEDTAEDPMRTQRAGLTGLTAGS